MTQMTNALPTIHSATVPAVRFERYWLLVLPLLVALLVLYIFPLARVLWLSFSVPQLGFGNYVRFFDNQSIHRVLWTTLRICGITTVLSVMVGYVIAYAMVHVGPRQRALMFFGLLVPFWASVLVRAFSWLFLLGDNGLINSFLMFLGITDQPLSLVRSQAGVIIGMVHFMIPYAVLPLYSNMKGIDPQLTRAAKGLGASSFTAFRKVFFPQTKPGILGASILVFVFSLGFYITPVILGGGRTVMIAEYITTQILQMVNWGMGTTLASVLLISILIALTAIARFVDLRQLFGAK